MKNAWQSIKKIFQILIFVYVISFIIFTNFLFDVFKQNINFDFGRYLLKILNL